MQMQSGGLSSGGEAQNAAKGVYAEYTLIPALSALCDRLNENYLPLFGLTPGEYWFTFDNPMGDDQDKIEESTRADTEKGIRTINEARAARNLDPIPEGDGLRIGGRLLSEIDSADKAATAAVSTKPDEDESDDDAELEVKPKPKKAAKSLTLYAKRMLGGRGRMKAIDLETDPYASVASEEASFRETMDEFYRTVNVTVEDGQASIDQKKERERLEILLLLFLTRVQAEGYSNGVTQIITDRPGTTLPLDPVGQALDAAKTWVKDEAARASKTIVQTISDTIKAAADKAAEAGGTPEQIKEAVTKAMGDLTEVGPERVASTETVRAFTEGRTKAAEDSEVVEKVLWVTQDDEKVCPFCGKLHGTSVDVGDVWFKKGDTMTVNTGKPGRFSPDYTEGGNDLGDHVLRLVFDYDEIAGPPLHPACRCWTEFVYVPAESDE